MGRLTRAVLLAVVLLGFLPVAAQTSTSPDAPDGLRRIVAQQEVIRADLADGGMEGVTPRQALTIQKAQKQVFAIAGNHSSLDELTIDQKISLENALEQINAAMVNTRKGDDAQNVCWRERATGSSIQVTRCGTAAEIREARDGARGFMERPRVCVPPGCGN